MSDNGVDTPSNGGGNIPPQQPNPPGPPQPPPTPPGPAGGLFQSLTLQRVALAVFVALALAVVLVALAALAIPQDTQKSLAISRTLTVLIITALACAAIAWLDQSNSIMIGRGVRHLLSIQRAAVASFVAASVATVGVAIFVALSALFAGGLEKGLYALASIEFLLKLAAVSAIIVLMTMRRPLVASVAAAPEGEGQGASRPVEVDEEDNGRLEFRGLSFAFSLVVIAALIVPGEDLMRMASMFFGGEQKLEQYLSSRPVITVEDELDGQITRAVVQWVASRPDFAATPLPQLESQIDILALQNQIFGVLANNLIDNVERRGALALLRAVCEDNEDTLIFANSDNRLLAEHISFLAAEGLIEQPYGDMNSIKITTYGSTVVKMSTGGNCVDFAAPDQRVATSSDDPVIATVPYENPFTLPVEGMTFRIGVPAGTYRVELVAIDRIDPYLELLTADGQTIIQSDDDGGPGFLDAGLNFSVSQGQTFTLRASTFGQASGRVSLRLFNAESFLVQVDDATPRVRQIDPAVSVATIEATPFAEIVQISNEGTVRRLHLEPGEYRASLIARDDADPFLQLFDTEGELVDENDDGPYVEDGLNSVLTFTVDQGQEYFLRTSRYGRTSSAAELTIDAATAPPDQPAVGQEAPPESPAPTGSGDSQ